MRYKAVVSYDGSNYIGFQSQHNGLGIQEVIEKALRLMTQTEIKIHSAGRTDKGVHALGQVFHFDSKIDLPSDIWVRGVNDRLPLDIRLKSVKKVASDFHARHSATSKVYRYVIAKNPETPFTKNYEVYIRNLDINPIKEALPLFVGTHDFRGFCQLVPGKPTVKTIHEVTLKETSKHYVFTFHGNSFLKYMVRSMMGTLIQIGLHRKEPGIISTILETKDRHLAGKTAESRGLFLVKINYKKRT
ncbi:MAG: tRNA pseudouridine(38-40) synthase TruA [Tenericutes bacterium GWC2_34_14]|nr:MAG: tRNA pseudouridine(38-40) synthase TruA [Tenericutes bacterium GWA2_35_7]OHE29022.1 MAG: tRNA pseudouridine(38-40) synthase TruA [Tenericutes bacterium GWC2_34_14]OHE33975.1 MAG: tRNA pseudouridine(38-40) synthase TruA [Tenericutes bacterium GWE2_34_108]OHE35308.1 MAG: tRNA pseudouridine(38-40) synthase TruA [Tenericutes bacterium GWF1_35_14]OHE38341.1 MAG: tRNA pseudouridine(38-40) synthase TruA [Tenericutes bacterium GWF2_35_184]OHE42676.1 MAG: tRNA pseudouridine(38-40) synthase TruA